MKYLLGWTGGVSQFFFNTFGGPSKTVIRNFRAHQILQDLFVATQEVSIRYTGAPISYWTFFMFILHDPSSRMTKPSYMI